MSQPSVSYEAKLSVSDFTKYLGAGHNVMDGDLRLTETTNGGETKYDIAKVNYGGSLRRLFFKDARATTSGEENLAVRVALYKAIDKEAKDAGNNVSNDLKAALGLDIVDTGENYKLNRKTSSKEALSRLTAQHIIEKFTGRQLSAEIRSTGGFDLIMGKYYTLGAKQDGEDACQDLRFKLYEFIAGNQNKSLDAPELKGLRSDLGVSLRQTDDGGFEIDRDKTKKTGLSEADAKKIAEKYAKDLVLAKVGTDEWKKQWKGEGKGNEIKQSYFRRFDAKNENVVTWRRFGGLKGLGLSKTQFDSLFDRALAVAVKDHAAEASGLKRLVAYYKAIFANKNAPIEDLQCFFGDERAYVEWKNKERGGENGEQIKESQFDFNEQAFAKKLWWVFTENPPLPEIDGKAHTLTKGGGLLPQGFMDQLVDYQNRMNTYDDIGDVITIAKTEKVEEPEKVEETEIVEENENDEIAPREKEVRGMIGDLFFNDANPMEMVKYGTSDGERLGRVLFGHLKTFTQICTEIKKAELVAKNGKPLQLKDDSYAGIAKKVLSQISSHLAQNFENMIRKINSFMKYERSGDSVCTLTFSECQNKAQNIFKAVEGFEKLIDDALEKFFTADGSDGHSNKVEDTKAYKQIVEDLKLPAGENSGSSFYLQEDAELLKNILRVNLTVSSGQDQGQGGVRNVALRRMLSAGTRYSNSGLDAGAQFDFGAMLRGGGPALIKRLQSVPAEVFANRDLKPNIRSALDDITHNLPGSGDLVLKTQLYGVLNNLKAEEQKKQQEGGQNVPVIQEIKVTKSQLGAASIAQTAKCTLVYDKDNENQQNKDVVIKLVRPDVKMAFDKECESFGKFESKKEGDESLKSVTKHFISDVGPEFELMKETLNAFVAIVANREGGKLDQAFKDGKTEGEKGPVNLSDVKDRNDLDSQLVKLLGQSNVRKYRTEQLIWKGSPNGEPTKEQLKAAENEIIECLNRYDPKEQGEVKDLKGYYNGLMEIAKKYCVMSSDFIVMKEAPGKPLDEFIADMSKEVENVVKGKNDEERKKVMDDLVNAKQAIMQLGEELFNGIAKGDPPAFHGDLHGGNIFYDKETGFYTLVDYGKGSPLTNDTAKAILNCFATVVKAYDRKPHNPDDTNAKGIDAQIEDRATEVIDAYRSVLQSELAVWKSENPDVEPFPEDIQLIQNTIDELDTNSDKFNKPFYDVLHGDLEDAMSGGNRNPGSVVETLTKTVKNYGKALSNTLFGFFDSYAKLEKNLTKIDDLIHKLDSNKYVTVFVKDELPFGQEDCRATLENGSQENRLEKLGAFYERLPKFIREEADEKVSRSVQDKMRAKWTALQELKKNSPKYQDNEAELGLDESSIIKGLGIDSWKEHKSKPLFNFFNQIHLDMQSPETNLVVSPRDGVKVGAEEVGGQDKPVKKENWTDDVLQLFYAVEKAKPLESESEDQVNGTEAKITNEKIIVSGEDEVFDNGRSVDDMVNKMNNLSLVRLSPSEKADVKSLAKKNYEAKKKIDKFFQLIIEGFASAPKDDVKALLKEMYLMTGKDENDPDYSNLVKITVGDSGLQECNKKMTFKTWSPERDEFYVDYENEAIIDKGEQKGKIYKFVDALKKVCFSDEVFKDEKVMAKMNALVEKYEYSSNQVLMAGARTAVKIFKLVMDESKRRDFLNSQHKTATELSNEEKKYGTDYEVFNTVEKLGEEKEVLNPDTGEMEVKKVNCGKDLVNLEDRCKAALDEIDELNSAIKQEFSGLGGIVNVAVNSLNGGK